MTGTNFMKATARLIAQVACVFIVLPIQAQTLDTDPLVSAMREELKYNMDQLKEKPTPVYFMSLRMNDTYNANVSSNMGISMSDEGRSRTITPHIRVGSPELDNFKYESQNRSTDRYNYSNSSSGPVDVPYTDGAIMAVRQGIWSETMKRYGTAVSNLANATSRMMTNADNEDKAPCFSDAPVELYYEKPMPESAYSFDRKAWSERLDRVSSIFKDCPGLESGIASIDYTVERITTVTSDGSAVVQNRTSIRLMLQGVIRATDGMTCPLYHDWFAYGLDNLPSDEEMIAAAKDLRERLLALRDAPIADPYAGPAIMSGSASGVFFHEIFGHRLEAHRMKSGGQTFKKLVGELVLPEGFQVYDDPSLDYYAGTQLYGHYLYDDEAVKGKRVQCVENGVLKNFLLDRTPIDGFPVSNGHGRAYEGYDPVSRQSNLIIETTTPYTDAELREMLLTEVRRLGKEYGYFFRTATSGLTYLGEGGSINSFGVDPVEVYQVYADGRPDKLVRGVTLIGTPLAMFSGIAAAGSDPTVFTGQCGAESGWVPVTAVSPTIYITKIETQRSETGYQLPQALPKPESKDVTGTSEEIIFAALQDELDRTYNGLQIEGQPAPFYVDYRVNEFRSLIIDATLGGLTSSANSGNRRLNASVNIQLGDTMVTNQSLSVGTFLGENADYNMIRLQLWQLGDYIYKNAIGNYSQKLNQLKSNPKAEDEANLPEFTLVPAREYIAESILDHELDREALEQLAMKLSAVYLEFPQLYGTNVNIRLTLTDAYRLNSEGLKLRMPLVESAIHTNAIVRTPYGAEISEYYDIPFDYSSYDADALADLVREFAQAMTDKADAPGVKDFYIGPIMIEGNAVSRAFNDILKSFGTAKVSWSQYGNVSNITGSMMLGKRMLDPKLGLHLYSDMESYKGQKLAGCYTIDFDGITPPSDFTVIEKGMLKNMICGRAAAPGATAHTGHNLIPMYIGSNSTPAFSTMHITSTKTMPESKMKAKLLSEAKKSGLEYAYRLRNISYNCSLLTRIDVKTGKEELVHPENIPNFGRQQLMHVIAVSAEENVQNDLFSGNEGSRLSTVIAPDAMILESVEIQLNKARPAEPFQLTNPAWR